MTYPNKTIEIIMTGSVNDIKSYNESIKDSILEVRPLDLPTMKKWITIRDEYTFTDDKDDIRGGDWEQIDIIYGSHSKYGINFLYIDKKRKLCRVKQTVDEFYGNTPYREHY